MTDFAIRDCLADKASRPVDFGKESGSHWAVLERLMPDTQMPDTHTDPLSTNKAIIS